MVTLGYGISISRAEGYELAKYRAVVPERSSVLTK
jgi:hypothetical protein